MITVKDDFLNLKTRKDVAEILNISLKKLIYHVYKTEESKRYFHFQIFKKNGDLRLINAPSEVLKSVQSCLNEILHEAYPPRPSVHGFTKKRSIITNAKIHARARYIINIDIENFFPTIHFGRIRGLLMSAPYSLPHEAATLLAHICCHEGSLPQGAPTSPILSNMICRKMDRDFQELAKKYRFKYSRYADDITFSTKIKNIPLPILKLDEENNLQIGDEIMAIITSNGFSLNNKKTRIQARAERQEVTGLTVNRFPNVPRKYVRQIRAMLYAWEKHGYKNAESEFISHYDNKHRCINKKPSFQHILKGKIEFLRMVRGSHNDIYLKFRKKFSVLEKRDFDKSNTLYARPLIKEEFLDDCIFVIEFEWEINGNYDNSQGTCFFLKDFGFITCAHVLPPENSRIISSNAFRHYDVATEFDIKIIKRNDDLDIAIIEIDTTPDHELDFVRNTSFIDHHNKILLTGFPSYKHGDVLYKTWGSVTQRRRISGVDRFIVNCAIVEGNSGGPVLNDDLKVVGIAATGISGNLKHGDTHNHGFIPISTLKYLTDVSEENKLES